MLERIHDSIPTVATTSCSYRNVFINTIRRLFCQLFAIESVGEKFLKIFTILTSDNSLEISQNPCRRSKLVTMDAPSADNPSLEEEDDGDNRGLGVEASGDHDDGAESGTEFLYNVARKKPPKRKEAPSPTKRKIIIREDQHGSDKGYDSDGMKGLFWNATRMEGNQLSDDEEDDDDDGNNNLREVLLHAPPPPLPPPPNSTMNATVSVPESNSNNGGDAVIDLINNSVGKHVPVDDKKLNTMKVKEIKMN